MRDDRDVLVSFYHYLITRGGLSMSFEDWFARYQAQEYGHRWERNVGSWLMDGQQSLGDNLLILHFEEMKTKPVEALVRVCRHLDIQTDVRTVETAVEQASLGRVQQIERERAKEKRTATHFLIGAGKRVNGRYALPGKSRRGSGAMVVGA